MENINEQNIVGEVRANNLADNAQYSNPTEIAFLKKREGNLRRDAYYHVESHNQEMTLKLNVSLNGNMSAKIGTHSPIMRRGRVDAHPDLQIVRWADTENIAIIDSGLGIDHIHEDMPASKIVSSFV